MHKRITVAQLRLGMFLHRLDGSWLQHPFMRSRFALQSAADLQAIRDSGIETVWIDTDRGLDVDEVPGADAAAVTAAGAQAAVDDAGVSAVDAAGASAVDDAGAAIATRGHAASAEFMRARQICDEGRNEVLDLFTQARMGEAIDPVRALPLVGEIVTSVRRDPSAIISVARLKQHDDYTYMHSVAVCALMVALGRTLRLADDDLRIAGLAGLMHDIGKARIPPEILNKPGRLSDAETELVRRHSAFGARILVDGGASRSVIDVAMHHHERVDGQGYPKGLAGQNISMLARMGAVCDVYDAVTSDRTYKKAWNPPDALRQMSSWDGHFDRQILQAFVQAVGIYPVGSLLRLSSGELAVVQKRGGASLLKPCVLVFYSATERRAVPQRFVDLGAPDCTVTITGAESPHDWGLGPLDELWMR